VEANDGNKLPGPEVAVSGADIAAPSPASINQRDLKPFYFKKRFLIFAWSQVILWIGLYFAIRMIRGDWVIQWEKASLKWALICGGGGLGGGVLMWLAFSYQKYKSDKQNAERPAAVIKTGAGVARRPGSRQQTSGRASAIAGRQRPGAGGPRVVIAIDSFKGTLSSREAALAVSEGLAAADPSLVFDVVAVSDGGEGLVEALVESCKGERATALVTAPMGGEAIEASFGLIDGSRTAVIETAASSGLTLVPESERNPMKASSIGLGEQIKVALDRGAKKLIIGLGGSATVDGGVGMAKALGAKFLGADGNEIPAGGIALPALDRIDLSGFDWRIKEAEIIAACDVTNPLLGEGGAIVYAPQKGASPEDCKTLLRGLERLADVMERDAGKPVRDMAGAGAAGGLGAACAAFLNARLLPGAEVCLEAAGFATRLNGAALVITGEGKMDVTTLSGKLPMRVAAAAREAGVSVAAFCGQMDMGDRLPALGEAGIRKVYSLVRTQTTVDQALANARELLKARAGEVYPKLKEVMGKRG
jgi:glycerate 2-kinase